MTDPIPERSSWWKQHNAYYGVPAEGSSDFEFRPAPRIFRYPGPLTEDNLGDQTKSGKTRSFLDYGDPKPRIWSHENMPPDPSKSQWSFTPNTPTHIAQILQILELGDLAFAQAKNGQVMTPPRCGRDHTFPEILAATALAKMQESGFKELPSQEDVFELYHNWNMYVDRAGLSNAEIPWGFRDAFDAEGKRKISWMAYNDNILPYLALLTNEQNVAYEASPVTTLLELEVQKDMEKMLKAQELVVNATSFMKSFSELFPKRGY